MQKRRCFILFLVVPRPEAVFVRLAIVDFYIARRKKIFLRLRIRAKKKQQQQRTIK